MFSILFGLLGKLDIFFISFLILFSIYCVGFFLSEFFKLPKNEYIFNFFLGYCFLITVISAIIFFPINNLIAYLIILCLPIVAYFIYYIKNNKLLINKNLIFQNKILFSTIRLSNLEILVISILSIYFLVSLMPEIGHDALASHLYIPSYVENFGKWDFEFNSYVWAISPFSANYFYTFTYILGGAELSKFFLFLFFISILYVIYDSMEGMGFNKTQKNLIILMTLSTSVFYLVTSSLYIDLPWLLPFVLLLNLGVKVYYKKIDKYIIYFLSFAALAVTTKHVSLIYFACFFILLAFFNYKFFLQFVINVFSNKFSYLFLLWMISPYLHAYIATGNPTFPFFNNIFQSSFFPTDGFNNPLYNYNDYLKFLYHFTFRSHKFIEGSYGSSGFFWLFFGVPVILFYLLIPVRKLFLFLFLYTILTWLFVFYFQSYIRYILPLFPIVYILFFYCLNELAKFQFYLKFSFLIKFLICICIFLNLIHLNSSTNYGYINYKVITSNKGYINYLKNFIPIQFSVAYINSIDTFKDKKILMMSAPQGANLKGKALYLNWYNHNLLNDFINSLHSNTLDIFYKKNNINYVIYDESFADNKFLYHSDILSKSEIKERIRHSLIVLNDDYSNLFVPDIR